MVGQSPQSDSLDGIVDTEKEIPDDNEDKNTCDTARLTRDGARRMAKNEALPEFVKLGDAKADEEMIRLGVRTTAKAPAEDSAGMYAAQQENPEISKAICESGNISIDDTNDVGQTALMLAAMNDHLEVVKTLLRDSPSLELKDQTEGRTAFFYALAHAHGDGDGDELVDSRWAIATAVLKAGADIEAEYKADLTPLAWFCRSGNFPAVRWLVQNGARGDTEGACCIIQHLADRGAGMELHNSKNGHTALFEAVVSACMPQLKLLIACGSHVNTFSRLRQLPFTIAAICGYDEVVEILLQHGPSVHVRDYLNRAPSNHASEFRRLLCVEFLIEHSSPLSVQNEHL
ncbi:ankyrin repeat domain-containing protein [Emericellopsis cladophorae]|uniref:Ankyrin repeat domain-containing protein n=1 Tax=Emericellopsis cladophorae TaxID=2686198 RepID=A0A9P9Y5C6_9HYPO|nr:ankyrin repeat domain-containing protein [Emericellopsis cladophorae]KAI6783640.1 ankyrin repeat domain-containing protein [Emericellopsis cladophorae]